MTSGLLAIAALFWIAAGLDEKRGSSGVVAGAIALITLALALLMLVVGK